MTEKTTFSDGIFFVTILLYTFKTKVLQKQTYKFRKWKFYTKRCKIKLLFIFALFDNPQDIPGKTSFRTDRIEKFNIDVRKSA